MDEKTRQLLEFHVEESNKIENIQVGILHHLFIDHLKTAKFVYRLAMNYRVLVSPQKIHGILMKNEPLEAGKYRKVWVRVGPYLKCPPELVNKFMVQWEKSLEGDVEYKYFHASNEEKENLAWHYHHWFEAIHPFIDGNGRTGRLILNNIRLLFNLPWLIVNFSERQEYYNDILIWEHKFSKKLLKI